MKLINVFFDLEGWWQDPGRGEFDIEGIMQRILDTLDKYGVKAAFNTCGIIAEKFPELIETIYSKEHEIASHGYKHENFAQLEPDELDEILAKTEELIYIEKRNYKWVSNKYITYPEIWSKPEKPKNLINTFKKFIKNVRFRKNLLEIPLLSSMDGCLLF